MNWKLFGGWKVAIFIGLLCVFGIAGSEAADPAVSNVRADQRSGTKLVDIWYDVNDADGDDLNVSVAVEVAGSPISASGFSGSGYGSGVACGNNRHIVWDGGGDWDGNFSDRVSFVVTADDAQAPSGMVYVEGGTFTMGDTWGDGESDEMPTNSVTISGFSMSKYEVTNDEMADIMNWAEDRGKLDVDSSSVLNADGDSQELLDLYYGDCQISWNGSAFVVDAGKGDYPCVEVSWYGAAAYCNYRSEKESLTPCYDLSDWACDWSASGYRLPTEAEWEYAAKGGRNGSYTKYSGSDDLDSVAWYLGNSDASGNSGFYSGHGTLSVGTEADNELGIHDMSGNVWEWCNDWYDSGYYGSSPASNPKGPSSGSYPVLRGGCWDCSMNYCRVANRHRYYPNNPISPIGFRCVR